MTQEQKAEAYSKAVEKAKQEYNTTTSEDRKQWLEELFPELKESKDELTWLTRYIEEEAYSLSMDIRDNEDRIKLEKLKKSLAWLRKQAKPVEINPTEFDLQLNRLLMQFESLTKEELASSLSFYLNVVKNGWPYKIEKKQGEKPQGKSALEAIKEEKVDNANKVEPKFHEGDWVIDKQGIVHQVANVVENVTNHTYGYDVVGGGYFNDNNEGVRLWSIQDAKDGDALVASDGSIFLFAGVVDCACKYYASLATDGYVKINKEAKGGYWETSRAVYPATKEQRDKLEKAMSDAGYAFDFDKKELKKIEKKSEEKSIIISLKDFQKAFELKAKQYDIELPNRGYDIHAMCKELYSLLIEQNSTWSEEDGNKVKELIGYLNELFDKYRLDLQELNDYEAWFKSIKKRLGGFKSITHP